MRNMIIPLVSAGCWRQDWDLNKLLDLMSALVASAANFSPWHDTYPGLDQLANFRFFCPLPWGGKCRTGMALVDGHTLVSEGSGHQYSACLCGGRAMLFPSRSVIFMTFWDKQRKTSDFSHVHKGIDLIHNQIGQLVSSFAALC